MSFLSQIYSGFYNTVYGYKLGRFRSKVQGTFKAVQRQMKRQPQEKIDLSEVRHILIIKNEGLGDMVVATPLIRNLALNGYKVDVLASVSNQVIIKHNPYVSEVLAPQGGVEDIARYVQTLKDRHYDLVLDARLPAYSASVEALTFPQDIACDYLIGWNCSHFNCYDESLNFYQRKEPIAKVMDLFLQYFDIYNANLSYDIFVDDQTRAKSLHYVRDLWRKGGPIVVFNPFASHETHDISLVQIRDTVNALLGRYPYVQIVLIGQTERLLGLRIEDNWVHNVYKFDSASILDVVPLIKYADVVISPATSIVHIAAAFHKPTVGLYVHTVRSPANGKENAKSDYDLQRQKIVDKFFDEPRIQDKVRPDDILRLEELFAPNNVHAVQVISETDSLADVPAQHIVNATIQLVEQYVDDAQYTGALKAIAYQPAVEQQV